MIERDGDAFALRMGAGTGARGGAVGVAALGDREGKAAARVVSSLTHASVCGLIALPIGGGRRGRQHQSGVAKKALLPLPPATKGLAGWRSCANDSPKPR